MINLVSFLEYLDRRMLGRPPPVKAPVKASMTYYPDESPPPKADAE